MALQSEHIDWSDIIDDITSIEPSVLLLQPSATRRNVDNREIVAINNAMLKEPVPVEALGSELAASDKDVARLEEALLDVYAIIMGSNLERRDMVQQ